MHIGLLDHRRSKRVPEKTSALLTTPKLLTVSITTNCGKFFKRWESVQLLSRVRLFVTPWTAAHPASLSITNSWNLLKFMSIESMIPSNRLILCRSLLLPSIFPSSGSFPMSQFFASGVQSTGVSASASVLPMNIQD